MGYLSLVFNKFHQKRDVDILNEFRERIWSTLPYEKLNRKYTYKISSNIEDKKIYNKLKEFSCIEYKVLKSRYKKNELNSEEYIKARINSNYGKYFDKELYLDKQYYYRLANYKNIYFSYLNGDCDNVLKELKDNEKEIKEIEKECIGKKLDLTWEEYKNLVNGIIPKIFDNYIPMDERIEEGVWKPNYNLDWDEDNYIIGYFNKSLDGYIKMYIDEKNGVRYLSNKKKNCEICSKEFVSKGRSDNSRKYCEKCSKEVKLKKDRITQKNIYNSRKAKSL